MSDGSGSEWDETDGEHVSDGYVSDGERNNAWAPPAAAAHKPSNVKLIAKLMEDIYTVLVRMWQIPASALRRGPHTDVPIEYAKKLGLTPRVIELIQELPYLEDFDGLGDENNFVFDGTFVDYRSEESLKESRDPFYLDPERGFTQENGEYMEPSMIPLSDTSNHGAIMILDTDTDMIWVLDGIDYSRDPALFGKGLPESPSSNENYFKHIPYRPAPEVLRDVYSRLVSLEFVPAGYHFNQFIEDQDVVRDLYRKHGWPDNFNAKAFDLAKRDLQIEGRAKYSAEEPLRRVECLQDWIEGSENELVRYQKALDDDAPPKKWVGKYEAFQHQAIWAKAQALHPEPTGEGMDFMEWNNRVRFEKEDEIEAAREKQKELVQKWNREFTAKQFKKLLVWWLESQMKEIREERLPRNKRELKEAEAEVQRLFPNGTNGKLLITDEMRAEEAKHLPPLFD